MRSLFTLIFFTFLYTIPTSGQISEEVKSMSAGLNPALVLEIPNSDANFVAKLWKKYIKPYGGKTKKTGRNGQWFTDDADIVAIGGSNSIDIYASSNGAGDAVYLSMWIDLGGAYLSSDTHPEQYTEGEKFLMRFALFVAKENTKLELEKEEQNLKKLGTALKRLERDNERYHREIELAKERIRKAEANIDANVIEQDNTRSAIELQQEVIGEVKKRLADLN